MLTQSQHDDLCSILAPAFDAGASGCEVLAAADRLRDDDYGHPLAGFLLARHDCPVRPRPRAWALGSGRAGDRVSIRLAVADAGVVQCELMVESGRRVQVWAADVSPSLARSLFLLWPAGDREEAFRRTRILSSIPGGWQAEAALVAAAVAAEADNAPQA